MKNVQKYIKAKESIEKALRELNKAAELIGDTTEYNDKNEIFHNSTVKAYNNIITAALKLNEAQKEI